LRDTSIEATPSASSEKPIHDLLEQATLGLQADSKVVNLIQIGGLELASDGSVHHLIILPRRSFQCIDDAFDRLDIHDRACPGYSFKRQARPLGVSMRSR
jgi:hypothetical protein